ncbi:hypothetical protein KC19_6G054300 [Ceratodon purpureus]|uniref:Histone deacetylase domain-containing protein n=1 Tax=Ceratodon purpureus TaxID=3225 RepID=A0A8T0HET2_CERPU|nr:hypothetical protein KC19_6G054300 [Ceratodon purpureus]
MSALWATPLRLLSSAHLPVSSYLARSPWRTLRTPALPPFESRFEVLTRGFRRLGSRQFYRSFCAGVGGVQTAEIRTDASALDESPRDGLLAFYADHYVVPLPEGHRFPMTKYRATRLLLEGDEQLRDILVTKPAPLAAIDDVCLVHDEGYVQRFISGGLTEKEQRAVGFPWSVEHRQRSLASTGGTVAAMRTVMQGKRRVSANIAGGTHHAFAGHGEGFCVFNDIAVASAICLRDYPTKCNLQTPILVVDLDVHQGNGTSKLFENDDRVITFDMHGAGNYPWKTKTKSNYDIGLPDNTGDEHYLATLAEWLPHLIELHDPSLVFFQAGVDALKEDSFGRLAMTREGLLKRNNMVYSACIERNLPLVITMGGGYSRPSDASIKAHADVYRSAALRYSAVKSRARQTPQ